MKLYLTTKYDIGDGKLKKKTPLEYAESLGADDVVTFLKSLIQDIDIKTQQLAGSSGGNEKKNVSNDRVVLAKARLEVNCSFSIFKCA